MARLQTFYRDKVINELMTKFQYKSVMEVPRITKVTINMGLGKAIGDKKILENAVKELTDISGQKPVVTKARKSIAAFKLREGWAIGAKVTLRRDRMYEFLDRLINVAMPRIRDFRGVSAKGFDGHGNYNCGLSEQLVFPEIDPETATTVQGMNITIVTTANTDDEGRVLLKAFGMPFRADN